MLGLEYSLSVIIVSIAQLMGFALQTVLVRKKLKESVFSHTFFFALFLALFNCSVLFLPIEMPFAASVVYVLLGAYYSSIRIEHLFNSRIKFVYGYTISVAMLALTLLVLSRVNVVNAVDQIVVISFQLTIFYIISGVLAFKRSKAGVHFLIQLTSSIFFVLILFLLFLFEYRKNIGIVALNVFFVGLILDIVLSLNNRVKEHYPNSQIKVRKEHFLEYGLSEAQLEVIELLAQDLDIPKIAIALGIGNNAVESRLSRIYKKTPYKSLYDLKVAIVKLNQPTT